MLAKKLRAYFYRARTSAEQELLGLLGDAIERRRWELIYQKYRRRYDIHPTFGFNGPDILLYGEGKIVLGRQSYIGRGSQIQSGAGCRVEIGCNCGISHYVIIYTENTTADQDFSNAKNVEKGDVIVGDNCWIGAQVYINQGISVGENSVVGAHSVVTRDIPPHSIAVGVPAKVTKFKSYLEKEQAKRLARNYWRSLSPSLRKGLNEET
jgi:acetyltransferase-like isoleucine patch superfamily enzyme